jgi:hypothetical protein
MATLKGLTRSGEGGNGPAAMDGPGSATGHAATASATPNHRGAARLGRHQSCTRFPRGPNCDTVVGLKYGSQPIGYSWFRNGDGRSHKPEDDNGGTGMRVGNDVNINPSLREFRREDQSRVRRPQRAVLPSIH